MKIELSPVAADKDAASKAPKDETARGAHAEAFDRAIRDAAPQAKSKGDAKTPREDRTEAKAQAEGENLPAPDASIDPSSRDSETEPAARDRSADLGGLQGLLNLMVGSAATTAPSKVDITPLQSPAIAQADVDSVSAIVAEAETGLADPDATGTKGLRLEVLHMETHFEPRQDGMVLVETPEAVTDGKRGDGRGLADLAKTVSATGDAKQPANSPALMPNASQLSAANPVAPHPVASNPNSIKPTAPKPSASDAAAVKPAVPETSGDDEAAAATNVDENGEVIRVRFDEALARLGRPAEGQHGGGQRGSRDGTATSQTVLVDMNARRAEVRGVDAVSAAGPASTIATDALSLTGQVAGRIVDALGDPSSSSAPAFAAPGETHLRMRAGGAALKTLTIQLQPEHLGTLEVSMRLSEGKLTVELSASQADTATLLLEDRGTLRKLLEHAGFALDDAAITVIAKDSQVQASKGSETSNNNGAARDNNASQERGENGRSSAGSSGGEPDRRQQAKPRMNEARAADRKLGSTYL